MSKVNLGILERERKVIADFQKLQNWEDRYKKIIALGKQFPELPEALKTEESKVRGCQSQVWLHAKLNENDQIELQADSDALLVRGLVALLVGIYSQSSPNEILDYNPQFLNVLGFESNLSPSRTNGLYSMIKQIRNFAVAFDYLLKSKK